MFLRNYYVLISDLAKNISLIPDIQPILKELSSVVSPLQFVMKTPYINPVINQCNIFQRQQIDDLSKVQRKLTKFSIYNCNGQKSSP